MKKYVWALTLLLLTGVAQAATLKIATVTPEGSQWMRDMRAGAAEIKERTEGRVEIKYYGGGIQGTENEMIGSYSGVELVDPGDRADRRRLQGRD